MLQNFKNNSKLFQMILVYNHNFADRHSIPKTHVNQFQNVQQILQNNLFHSAVFADWKIA